MEYEAAAVAKIDGSCELVGMHSENTRFRNGIVKDKK